MGRRAAILTTGRVLFVAVALVVFVIDRVTKSLIVTHVPFGTEFAAIDHLVFITNLHNSGAAFGVAPAGAAFFLVAAMAVAVGLIFYVFTRPGETGAQAVLGLILGGTLGNGFDRLAYGTVTDFIALHFWPVFNVADSAISVGVLLLIGGYLLRRPAAS